MDRNHVTDDDQGKAVVDSTGRKIGMVTEVNSGTAHVNADPGLTDTIRSKLGWGDADEDDYALDEDRIHTITDDEIRLTDSF
ncbi:PRC-barrel domain containing protein [Halonotius terrestris]|uniref:PRC-barrel domain containing protein n=1 Tax=Halonotius terrestris TaxID=2487750 RepID=A0A8J8TCD9_9EURY|nr:PRC-barrel domain containing protein [Halonotius terrestris]TQQ81098.1 PRC-barrel domain containing protein [Halonotius terrestris]